MVLPLKPEPVVHCTKDIKVKALGELLESFIENQLATAGLSMTLHACGHLHPYPGTPSLLVLATKDHQHCE